MRRVNRESVAAFIEGNLSRSLDHLTLVCFGTGGSAEDFMRIVGREFFDVVVDNNNERWGKKWHGLLVQSPAVLQQMGPRQDVVIVINSSYQVDITRQLNEMGFALPQHRFNGLAFTLPLPGEMFRLAATRTLADFFSEANSCVRYVVMRSYSGLPTDVPSWDIDLLVEAEDENVLRGLSSVSDSDHFAGLGIECYWVPESAAETTYYPHYLAQPVLRSRELSETGVYVPSSYWALMILAHTCLYLKSTARTGLSFDATGPDARSRYTAELLRLSGDADRQPIQLSLTGLARLLREEGLEAPLDWARHIEQSRRAAGEDTAALRHFLRPMRVTQGHEIVVFVLRECAISPEIIQAIRDYLEGIPGIEFVTQLDFSKLEAQSARTFMRSGNWAGTEADRQSGGPAGIIICTDADGSRYMSDVEREVYPYRGNPIYSRKNDIRNVLNQISPAELERNFLHSPDDEREAIQYLSLLRGSNRDAVLQIVSQEILQTNGLRNRTILY